MQGHTPNQHQLVPLSSGILKISTKSCSTTKGLTIFLGFIGSIKSSSASDITASDLLDLAL
jgi:hypothetical protein